MPDYTVPGQLLQEIADYLAVQPYRDVAKLIAGLSQVKPVEIPVNEPEKQA